MMHSVTQNNSSREEWIQQLADAITDPNELLQLLNLSEHEELRAGFTAHKLFTLLVPKPYLSRIRPGDANDPLLLQIMTQQAEHIIQPGYSSDPLNEQVNTIPGLLHKYHNRALLIVKTGCAIHCRYCFRKFFPYQLHPSGKKNWQLALDYIQSHAELDEIIFSGGDPLMAKDHELDWLISQLEAIPHIKRLRIHSRLATVIPARISPNLCKRFAHSSLQILLVTHINHANEIDHEVHQAMARLKAANVTLLNQSVLLRNINDDPDVLAALSNQLFNVGILPYYLHLLDKVTGTQHFLVDDAEARVLHKQLMSRVSGYLVPRLTREISGEPYKTPLDLHLS